MPTLSADPERDASLVCLDLVQASFADNPYDWTWVALSEVDMSRRLGGFTDEAKTLRYLRNVIAHPASMPVNRPGWRARPIPLEVATRGWVVCR